MDPSTDVVVRRLRPASLLPFVVLAVFVLLQIISPANAWSWAAVGLGVLLLVSYYWARQLRDHVSASRDVQGSWVVAGDELHERFTLSNTSWLPAIWARVRDFSQVPGYSAQRVESVDGHGERSWTYIGICQRRGVFRLGPWNLDMSDPFGFFEVTQHYPAVTTIMVYPRASRLPDFDLPRGASSGRARSAERSAAETINVSEVRDYRPGDSLRRVHWPATAHHDRLLVREFDREPTGDLWLILDLDAAVQAGHGAEATAEYAVVLAASLASQLLRSGERRAVGLLVSGRNPALLPPSRGPAQLWQILAALTEAEPGGGDARTGARSHEAVGWRRALDALRGREVHGPDGMPALPQHSGSERAPGHGAVESGPAMGAVAGGIRPWWAHTQALLRALAASRRDGTGGAEPGVSDSATATPRRPLSGILEDLGRTLGSGRTLVIITPSQDPAWVGPLLPLIARGNAPVVLLLDATTFDPPTGSQEALAGLRALLGGQRIPVYVLAQGFPFEPIERIRRRRRTLETLPGTGRVIAREIEEEV